MKKPFILCIIGESGSGKTTIAEYIEKIYNIKMICSWTDRPKRFPNEPGHSWATREEFDKFKKEDMIAFTKFGDYRYCCLKSDVKDVNTYVIDESGLKYLKDNFSDIYNIKSFRVIRPLEQRINDVGSERVKRDKGNFRMASQEFDYLLDNNFIKTKTLYSIINKKLILDIRKGITSGQSKK